MNVPPPLLKIYSTFANLLPVYSPLAKVQWTFANISLENSPIGESSVGFRQYIHWKFANWRKFSGLSPIYPLEIRQLAKVQWTFASTSSGFPPIIGESLIGEVPDSPFFSVTYRQFKLSVKFFFRFFTLFDRA